MKNHRFSIFWVSLPLIASCSSATGLNCYLYTIDYLVLFFYYIYRVLFKENRS
nr:MAG TPA: hypothetical protein [Caudoviricetes sp.]